MQAPGREVEPKKTLYRREEPIGARQWTARGTKGNREPLPKANGTRLCQEEDRGGSVLSSEGEWALVPLPSCWQETHWWPGLLGEVGAVPSWGLFRKN